MQKIGLFYASETGNTQTVATTIQQTHFQPGMVDIYDMEQATAETIAEYSVLILGAPTVGCGDLPDALDSFLQRLGNLSFVGKTVALFGLGDQEIYPHEFVDALGVLCEELESRGAEIIGAWPTEGYDFSSSRADLGDGRFCGLVLDEDNQFELTGARLESWIAQIKPTLMAELDHTLTEGARLIA